MHNLLLLIVCFLAGGLLRGFGKLPQTTPSVLNGFIIHVSLPAVVLLYIHDLSISADVLYMAAMPWLHFGLGALFFLLLGKFFNLPRTTVGALILTGGLGNTSFLGLPMIEAFYGEAGIGSGIIVDQLGSFMVLSTLGITVAGIYSDGKPSAGDILKKIVFFPPFIALLVAVMLIPVDYPLWFSAVLGRLGDTLAPLALFSVGYQLNPVHFKGNVFNLFLGLGFKLLLAPFFFYVLYVHLFGLDGLPIKVTVFEAAMPPMITAGIIATEHGIDPPLANMMVAVGVVLSFLTLPLWWMIL
ncbi:AEC family transporter [Prosthecochloris sp. SCSIO W1101]|uniref:AEC family transporter n=1 Tax=Prosthecochloris sp. SCSIO W1101 TaxID=2992242 RepID=UPI00223DB2FA|nr:AEC family transporter [Prosthecochloris sp. SCSIO W1101]UZJ40992.1 AEC family transporter [Prosthecochloris sp. SCSIO W1101]